VRRQANEASHILAKADTLATIFEILIEISYCIEQILSNFPYFDRNVSYCNEHILSNEML